jgi:hypothetical protein
MGDSDIQQKQNKTDEIDIFEFCARLWSVFKTFLIQIKDFLVSIIIYLIRKSLWIASLALIGAVAGFALYTVTKTYYSSNLVVNTGEISNKIIIDHINKLSVLNGKTKILSGYLDITEAEAEEITRVKAYYGIDINKDYVVDYIDFKEKYNPKDTNQVRVPGYLYLKVSVYNEAVFPALRKGLFQYISRNEYIKQLHEINLRQKREYIKELEIEMTKIDSLQRIQFQKNSTSIKDILLTNKPEIQLFHGDILHLYSRKQALERDLDIYKDPIVIVQDFTPLEEEERPVTKYVLILGIVGAVLGLICAIFWQYRKKIWKLIKEDSSKS